MGSRSLAHAACACSLAVFIWGGAEAATLDQAAQSPLDDNVQAQSVSLWALPGAAAEEALPAIRDQSWSDKIISGTSGGALLPRESGAAVRAIYGGITYSADIASVSGYARVNEDDASPVPLPAASWLLASGVLALTVLFRRAVRVPRTPPKAGVLLQTALE